MTDNILNGVRYEVISTPPPEPTEIQRINNQFMQTTYKLVRVVNVGGDETETIIYAGEDEYKMRTFASILNNELRALKSLTEQAISND